MSQTFKEITVKIKNDEQRYTEKFPEYDPLTLSDSDAKLNEYVNKALQNFKGPVEDIQLVIKMEWRVSQESPQ